MSSRERVRALALAVGVMVALGATPAASGQGTPSPEYDEIPLTEDGFVDLTKIPFASQPRVLGADPDLSPEVLERWMEETPLCSEVRDSEVECRTAFGAEHWTAYQQNRAQWYINRLFEISWGEPGYGEPLIDAETGVIQFNFAGDPPDGFEEIAAEAAADGLTVVHSRTKYSQADLMQLADDLHAEAARADLGLISIQLGTELDELIITFYMSPDEPEERDFLGDPQLRAHAESVIEEVIGDVSYRMEQGGYAGLLSGGRQDDKTPYWGGARLRIPRSGYIGWCTSGMPMRSPSANANYLLTAAHCTDFNNYWQFTTGSGSPLGDNSWTGVLWGDNDLDATLVRIGTQGVAGRGYSGTWNSNTYVDIHSWAAPSIGGTEMCLSGSVTGTDCLVYRHGGLTKSPWGSWAWPASRTAGDMPIAGGGDSGGPMYSAQLASGKRQVFGILHAGFEYRPEDLRSCIAARTDPSLLYGNTCYRNVWIVPMVNIATVLSSSNRDIHLVLTP